MTEFMGTLVYWLSTARPGWVVIGCALLLAPALWLGLHAWRTHWHMDAIGTPAASVPYREGTRAKVAGDAAPLNADPAGQVVWSDERIDTYQRSGNSSEIRYSTAPFRIRAGGGDVVIQPDADTEVVPSGSDTQYKESAFRGVSRGRPGDTGSSTAITSRELLAGPAFAVGVLRSGDSGQWQLVAGDATLVVSGVSEAAALNHYRLRFWPAIAGILLLLGACAQALRWHLLAYDSQSLGEFVQALKEAPWGR